MTVGKPVVLCILDGWGLRDVREGNAVALADTPVYDRIMATAPHATLVTHGPDVGLPTGQMGNSEVGHTNIGAGRVVAMDLGQIDLAIEDGSFFRNPEILHFAARVKAAGGRAHLLGIASDGGVHGHVAHIVAATRLLTDAGLEVVLHLFTDGRDVAPGTAAGFVGALESRLPKGAVIGTLTGRYYAMDRDNRWERVRTACDAILDATALHNSDTALAAVTEAAARGETDEFIAATVIADYAGAEDGDGLFCLNFRADRVRQILRALAEPGFHDFDTGPRPEWSALLGMAEYSEGHNAYMAAAYPKRKLVNTLGEWVSGHGLRQFRLAETEKYPHVTFFLNGGREAPYPGEERAMPASPKVATYDLQPQMSAPEVTDRLVEAIGAGFDLIVVNYANPDMVGHTGVLSAAIAACEAVDRGLGRAVEALQKVGGALVLTADHGNSELMIDPETGRPHTAHTTNPVPVAVLGGPEGCRLRDGRLADLAPTVLDLMGLEVPPEMTGTTLIQR